jgi:hypothetical protein
LSGRLSLLGIPRCLFLNQLGPRHATPPENGGKPGSHANRFQSTPSKRMFANLREFRTRFE